MKKQFLLALALLFAVSLFPQGQRSSPPVNKEPVSGTKSSGSGAVRTRTARTSATTWQSFTSSMSIYGVLISYSKPLQWHDELDAVTFVHRKSPDYPASGVNPETGSGAIVTMISTDCGQHWDSTLVFADPVTSGRYPQGGIYNPPANTDITKAYLVNNGPATQGGEISGNFYASKPLGTLNYNTSISPVPGAVKYFASAGPYPPGLGRHDMSAYGFAVTDDGKVRSMACVLDTALMLVTGTFNAGTMTFDWSGQVFDPPATVSSLGQENWIIRPMMAWNEAGTVGYVVVIGSRPGMTGSNAGFQPIVYKTTDSGVTWHLESGIDFQAPAYTPLKNRLWGTDADPDLKVPYFCWEEGMDCTVDADNRLHIFTAINSHKSTHPDSVATFNLFTGENYRWPHTPGFHPYLYDFVYDGMGSPPAWSYKLIDSLATEGVSDIKTGAGYEDNPWDPIPPKNMKVRVEARLQMSRTPDGRHLLYSWADSDTLVTAGQRKWNTAPNIRVHLYDVAADSLNPDKLNITEQGGAEIANRAMCFFISPKFRLEKETSKYWAARVPVTVSNSNPYVQGSRNTHWFSCASLEFSRETTVGLAVHEKRSSGQGTLYPNPARSSTTLRLDLDQAQDFRVEVMNMIGQVVRHIPVSGRTGSHEIRVDLGGLPGGIYLVSVKTDRNLMTRKLVIE